MSEENQVIIKQVIVHKVDHHKSNRPQLSDLKTPVPKEVATFLKRHIVSSREHKYTNIANFVNGNENQEKQPSLKKIIDKLLLDSNQFVDQSKVIAKRLFNVVKNNKKISPSELVICSFSESGASDIQLALLKMDPEDGFIGSREKIKNKLRFVMRRIPEMLPTGGLQKCAFILPERLREIKEYDLKVLDMQQKRYGIQKFAASFFTESFLQCEFPPPSEVQTDIFLDESKKWVDRKKEKWSEEDLENFNERLKQHLMKETVDVDIFSQKAIKEPEEQEEYVEALKESGLESLTFTAAPKVREQMAKYIWFEGADGLKVRIRPDDVGDPNVVGEGKMLEQVEDEVTNNWIITIRTAFWEKKIRRGGR